MIKLLILNLGTAQRCLRNAIFVGKGNFPFFYKFVKTLSREV